MGNQQTLNEKQIWKSALILTIAGIITKVLSAAYRIPFQNIAGDIGFYIYQQVYPFYGIALILSTYGFPVIISKMLAEQIDHKKNEALQVLAVSFCFLSLFFIGLFLLLYTGSGKIASLMGDQELITPLRVVSFSFLFVPILSVLRGYFQGGGNMTPTAASQIGEQSVRVATILVFSYLLLTNGYSSYISSAGAIFGSIAGGFCSMLILLYFWIKMNNGPILRFSKKLLNKNSLTIVKALVVQGFTICVSSLFLILLQLVDAMTLLSGLVDNGHFSITDAKIEKGIFDRGQPLIQLGTVVATSLSLTLVPLISSAKARKDLQYIKDKVQLSFRVSIIIGLGAALGLIAIIKPTNIMLFTNMQGSLVLAILAATIFFSSILMTAAAIIQGLGKCFNPAAYVVVGVICKIILNYLLIPHFATMGAALATVIAYFVAAVLHIKLLRQLVPIQFFTSYIMKVLLAGLCMVISLYSYQYFVTGLLPFYEEGSRMFATFQSLSAVMIGGFIYVVIVIKTKIFTEEELSMLPFGKKLIKLMKGKQ